MSMYRRLGGEIAVERSPPTGKSSFEFVLVPCVRARRSCVGQRQGFTPLWLGVRQHECFPLWVVSRLPTLSRRWLDSVARGCPHCPAGGSCCPVGGSCCPAGGSCCPAGGSCCLAWVAHVVSPVVPMVSRGEIEMEIDSAIDSGIDGEIDCKIDSEIESEIGDR